MQYRASTESPVVVPASTSHPQAIKGGQPPSEDVHHANAEQVLSPQPASCSLSVLYMFTDSCTHGLGMCRLASIKSRQGSRVVPMTFKTLKQCSGTVRHPLLALTCVPMIDCGDLAFAAQVLLCRCNVRPYYSLCCCHRHQHRHLCDARGQVTDLWAAVASFSHKSPAMAVDASPALEMGWEADQQSVPDQPYDPIDHTTSV